MFSAGFLLSGHRDFLFLRVVLLVSDASWAEIPQEEPHCGQHAADLSQVASRKPSFRKENLGFDLTFANFGSNHYLRTVVKMDLIRALLWF